MVRAGAAGGNSRRDLSPSWTLERVLNGRFRSMTCGGPRAGRLPAKYESRRSKHVSVLRVRRSEIALIAALRPAGTSLRAARSYWVLLRLWQSIST